jgi:hypothetical protein
VAACAVTPQLREWFAAGDSEELEYAALGEVARAGLHLLDLDPLAPRRRVVVAAEVPADWVVPEPDRGRSAVRVDHVVPEARVVSGHLDDTAAEVAVAAAADAVVAAELGSDDAQFVVDEADGHELMWYAAQELDALVELG